MKTRTKILAAAIALACGAAHAGVTTDGTLTPAQSLTGPHYAIGAELGKTAGNNLFHSFGQFGLQAGESATFSGPANIANVISRVTGGTASTIAGQINVGIAGANFYFINPAGVVFNNGAALNVPGAVLFSTASSLHFSGGAAFGEASGEPDGLTFSGAPAAIAVLGASLTAAKGKTLALVGGNVTLAADPAVNGSAAALNAPSGNIVVLSLGNGNSFSVALPSYAVAAGTSGGTLTLAAGSRIVSSENTGDSGGAGAITLYAGQLNASSAEIRAETVNGNSAGVSVTADAVTLDNTQINTATIGGTGNAGPISISAGSIDILNKTQIDSSSDPADRNDPAIWSGGSGNGGDIVFTATGRISMSGCTTCLVPTAVVSNAFGDGKAGNITFISGQDVALSDYAVVQSDSAGFGDAGTIGIRAVNLNITGGGQLSSGAKSFGSGGNISLVLSGGLNIVGQGIDMNNATVPSGIFTNTYDTSAGGQIDISATTVAVTQGGEISGSSYTGASGDAGLINITASQSVLVSGQAPRSGIYTNALGYGDAGGLTITSPLLTVSDGGMVQSQNLVSGAGGDINLNVGRLFVIGGGQISVDTQSSNPGGNINIKNADLVSLTGRGSGIFAATAVSTGNGGSISIGAKSLVLDEYAAISADTSGSGMGGNISITTTESVGMNGGASISAKSFFTGNGDAGAISIDAGPAMRMVGSNLLTSTANAQGGNISVKARDLLYMQKSRIVSEAHVGAGSGGNVTIDPVLTVMNQSQIVANAFGGNGGNIDITTGTFLKSPDSAITASSQLGISGNIQISSPVLDLSAQIAPLPRFGGDLRMDSSPCAQARKSGNGFGITRAAGWHVGGTAPLPGVPGAQAAAQQAAPPYVVAMTGTVELAGHDDLCVW